MKIGITKISSTKISFTKISERLNVIIVNQHCRLQ
jgi:hypothetical protein